MYVHLALLFKQLGLTGNLFYAVSGAFLIIVFLVARIMNVPITVTIYAAQYHKWDLLQALSSMKTICHIGNAIQFSLQMYWFVLLLRLAVRVVRGWFRLAKEEGRGQSDSTRTENAQK